MAQNLVDALRNQSSIGEETDRVCELRVLVAVHVLLV